MGTKLGQHFLTSLATAERMVRSAGVKTGDTVLEIGPGKGILTNALLARGCSVIAIEKDPALVQRLRRKFPEKDRLVLIESDIRDVLKKPRKYNINLSDMLVIANIPYYLSGQLFRLLVSDTKTPPRLIVFMVQKEVAERIVLSYPQPRLNLGQKMNLLALSIAPFMEARIAFRVSRRQFQPPPAVDSAVLILRRRTRSLLKPRHIEPKKYFALIRAAFMHKRKFAISHLSKVQPWTKEAFKKCAVPHDARAEDISFEKWLCIAENQIMEAELL